MRVPSYRKHVSGQARVTIRRRDYLLGPFGSKESWSVHARLIAEFNARGGTSAFGMSQDALVMDDLLLAYLKYVRSYYAGSNEFKNLRTIVRVVQDPYGDLSVRKFGPAEFRTIRKHWLYNPECSRQYVNQCMKRILRIIK